MIDALLCSTCFAGPSATTWPPCSPAPGPMSTSQSAARIICSSCSTTSTVLPEVAQALERPDQLRRCRAGGGRSTARRGCRARRRAASRSGSRAAAAAPRRPESVEAARSSWRYPTPTLSRNVRRSRISLMIRAPMSASVSVSSSAVEELDRARHGELRQLVDVLAADRDREHLGLEPRPAAGRTRAEAHVLLDPLALLRGVGLLVAPLEARDDPLEGEHVRPPPAHAVAVGDVDLVAVRPVQEQVLLLLGQVVPGLVDVDLVALGDRLDDRLVVARAPHRPGDERALGDGEARVGDEQVGVDLLLRAEAGAARAGAVRRVEGEDARLQLRQADPVLGAGEALGERHAARRRRRRRSRAGRRARAPSRSSPSAGGAGRPSSRAGRRRPRSCA